MRTEPSDPEERQAEERTGGDDGGERGGEREREALLHTSSVLNQPRDQERNPADGEISALIKEVLPRRDVTAKDRHLLTGKQGLIRHRI